MIEFILYVQNQEAATEFYSTILHKEPVLHVPGMTEFLLNENCKLGLMPNIGIATILGNALPHPESGIGIPRCELYIFVDDIQLEFEHALHAGANVISGIEFRNWGDTVCYFSDPDGHVLAFAQKRKT